MATSTADIWKRRIDKWAAEYHKKEHVHDEARKFYHNQFPAGLITVNLVFSYGRAMVPQLYFKNPSVTVQIKGENAPLSRLLQESDIELIRQMNLKRTIKKLIVSGFLTGRGVGKHGFAADPMPVFDPAAMVKPRQPWFLHVLTKNFAHEMAPNGDMDDVPWAAMKTNLTRDQLDNMDISKSAWEKIDSQLPEDDPDETIEAWEVYDRGSGERGLLIDDEWAMEPGQFSVWPFYSLEFNWTPEEAIPVSDAELILHLQKEYNENETQIHEHRRISLLRLLARKGVFKAEEQNKLEKGVVGVLVEADTSGALQEAVMPLAPGIPEDLFLAKKTLQDDARDVIGFSRNQIGEFQGSGSSRRTFGEAAIVQQALQIRLDERRDMVADLIEQVMRATNQTVFKEWNADDAKRYAGVGDGWNRLKMVSKDDYTITVVPDSTLPLTKAVQRQQGIELYQALRGDPLIDQVELRKVFLNSLEGVDPDKLLDQQAVAQLQATAQATGLSPAVILQMVQGAQQGGQRPGQQPRQNGGGGQRRSQGAQRGT